jgi:hypothetical protein
VPPGKGGLHDAVGRKDTKKKKEGRVEKGEGIEKDIDRSLIPSCVHMSNFKSYEYDPPFVPPC